MPTEMDAVDFLCALLILYALFIFAACEQSFNTTALLKLTQLHTFTTMICSLSAYQWCEQSIWGQRGVKSTSWALWVSGGVSKLTRTMPNGANHKYI